MMQANLRRSFPAGGLEQAVADLMKTVALEETTLARMLDIEREMLHKAKDLSANLEEFVAVNESVNSVLRNMTKALMMTQIKLQYLDELMGQFVNSDDEDLEE